VLLATDRSGVLASNDGASTWAASTMDTRTLRDADRGDQKIPTRFTSPLSMTASGGVFYSHDGGQHWLRRARGLGGKDVFTLKRRAMAHWSRGTTMVRSRSSTTPASGTDQRRGGRKKRRPVL